MSQQQQQKKLSLKQRIKIKTLSSQHPDWEENFVQLLLEQFQYDDIKLAEEIYQKQQIYENIYQQYIKKQQTNQNFDFLCQRNFAENNQIQKQIIFQSEQNNSCKYSYPGHKQLKTYLNFIDSYNEQFSQNFQIKHLLNDSQNNNNNEDQGETYNNREIWPKYIGSLQTFIKSDVMIDEQCGLLPHQELFIQFKQLEFITLKTQDNRKFTTQMNADCLSQFVKNGAGNVIGELCHKYHFIWTILVNSGYIDIRCYFLQQKEDSINIRIDVYLKKEQIFKELHVLDEVQMLQKDHRHDKLKQITKESVEQNKLNLYIQESLYLLFTLLRVKISVPALLSPNVKLKNLNILHNRQYRAFQEEKEKIKLVLPKLIVLQEFQGLYYNKEIDSYDISLQKEAQQQSQNQLPSSEETLEYYDSDQEEEQNKKQQENNHLNNDNEQQQQEQTNLQLEEEEHKKEEIFLEDENQDQQKQDDEEEEEEEERPVQMEDQIQNQDVSKLLSVDQSAASKFVLSDQPLYMKSQLMEYQLQALTWMQYREGHITYEQARGIEDQTLENLQNFNFNDVQGRKLGIFWREMKFFDGTVIYFNCYTGQITNIFVKNTEKMCKGGILADEMGLGKTLMALSLIMNNQSTIQHKERKIIIEDEIQEEFNQEQQQNHNQQVKLNNHQNTKKISQKKPKKQLKQEDDDEEWNPEPEIQKKIKTDFCNFLSRQNSQKQKYKQQLKAKQKAKEKGLIRAGTLIIVPKTLMKQWVSEMQIHIEEDQLHFLEYYEQRIRQNAELHLYDIVITTYNLLGIEYTNFKKQQKSQNLFNYQWHRIILDEGHIIKGKGNNCSQGAYNLLADHRWVLTGTPLQNKLDDIYSLVNFLKLDVFENYQWWNKYINKNQDQEEVFGLLSNILHPILLRRTKNSVYSNGDSILNLPEKENQIIKVKFCQEERDIYNAFYRFTQHIFQDMLKRPGSKRQYLHVFAVLQRLRQICDHFILVFNKPGNFFRYQQIYQEQQGLNIKKFEKKLSDFFEQDIMGIGKSQSSQSIESFTSEQIQNIINDQNGECAICQEAMMNKDRPKLLVCGHIYHSNCINDYIEHQKNSRQQQIIEHNRLNRHNQRNEDEDITEIQCPQCRQTVNLNKIKVINPNEYKINMGKFKRKMEEKNRAYNELEHKQSSKIKAVIQEVEFIKQKREKCIIYTQWIPFMDMLERELLQKRIRLQRLDGSMQMSEREEAIKLFTQEEQFTVFLISLKAGAYGLNLVAANHVLLCDPWWNPSVEEQAADRCHRIGQRKRVYVKNFVCENSIEERIIDLQNIKRKLIKKTITQKDQNIGIQQYNNIDEQGNNQEEDLKFLLDIQSQQEFL